MTEKAFVQEGYCWQAFNKARCSNWDKNKSCKIRTQLERLRIVYVLFAECMTAENLLRIFPKGSKLKKNTNFTLDDDLTSLDCSSQLQLRMTEHSLFELFPSWVIFFCFVFSFFRLSSLQMPVLVRLMQRY